MTVNVRMPAAFFAAALGIMRPDLVFAAITGVVAERPHPGMAHISACSAALCQARQVVGEAADTMVADAERLRMALKATPLVERLAR
jgi:hypothetical protein